MLLQTLQGLPKAEDGLLKLPLLLQRRWKRCFPLLIFSFPSYSLLGVRNGEEKEEKR